MPKKARKIRRAPSRSTRRVVRRRLGRKKISDIHTFKGTVNAGIINAVITSTSTHLGGAYIFKLTDLPIIATGGALSNSFDFVRLNKCRMEFMPRYNQQSEQIGTSAGQTPGLTFLTGLDEVPVVSSSALTVAPTWLSQADEDAGVTEATAYDHPRITPDYIRGMPNGKETEVYKKHVVHFTPVFYEFTSNNVANFTAATPGNYKPCKKQWVNLNYLNQGSGTEVQSEGPDFYGPMYSLSGNIPTVTPGGTIQYYDVKLHYSVSFRRLRGI